MLDFDYSLLLSGQYHDMLLSGLMLSIKLACVTLVCALPLALFIALLRLSPVRPLQWLGFAYVESIRNIPLLAHMLFWYFAAPEFLPESFREWLYAGNIEAISAIVALTLYTAAFMSEDIRSGIRAIPIVQLEAGRALGFGYLASMRLVVLPQALRVTVAPLISQTLNLWKNTSIATVVGVAELMYQAGQVETATFRSLESFAFATSAYLSVSLLITGAAAWYQHRYVQAKSR
ncbi:ABC transporter permease subunit [Pseudomonas helleri]|uniref:ABC transporter permease subunit n=1 Tax=Pseudomonas helleri TaxID=1608996 RepID=A0A0J6I6Q9_9PSED|nr:MULTISPECIES: amino acid ABC transporter permease [Pseudomonas]KMN10335.1 ABC transporter permease [Pseudomonas helleri]MQT29539.1 ABC transporter permease subunit [Pseudomonas helleri]MQT47101.1 ABC transporter permease subunit [Pseudomonas helleri]MQT56520.1 ABC transporter permease subunit [Pseudomonas sp. FSL R10-0399]MQT87802.1 ABC transporter permease subunit [Pseudomonas helleri]